MKYMGSKNRIAKYILPIILKDRREGQHYVEPFVGGCNSIDKVKGHRLGNDNNVYLIAMLKALQTGFIPPKVIPKSLYNKHRDLYYARDLSEDYLTGYIGINGSYNGRFFDGGYAGVTPTRTGIRDYPLEAYNNVMKQVPSLLGIIFSAGDYEDFTIPDTSIIYCDAPYLDTKEYRDSKQFDYEKYYTWLRRLASQGHKVFVSEYVMPDDFTCIWSKEQTSSLTQDTGSKRAVERLFTL